MTPELRRIARLPGGARHLRHLFRALLVASAAVFSPAARSAPAASAAPVSERPETLRTWGVMFAHEEGLPGIELSDAERNGFLAGARRQLEGQPPAADRTAVSHEIERLAAERRQKIVAAETQRNRKAAEAFFAALDAKPTVVRLPSGLRYEVLASGTGEAPRPEQTAVVHYTGRLIDGTEFVQMGPFDVILVPQRVNRALFEGIQHARPGGSLRLYVPPELSSGEEAKLGIPPGSATIYDVELTEVKPTSAEDLANSLLPPAPEPPPPPSSGVALPQVIETWGWIVAQKTGAVHFGLKPAEIGSFIDGLGAGIRGATTPSPAARANVQAFVAAERATVKRMVKEKRLGAMNALFAELKRNPAVTETPSGLRYEILQRGEGAFPRPGQIVIVDYVGRLLDGTVFDRTDNEPLHIQVGSVIEGFNEGIQKINRGGRIRLYVPPTLGYGDEDMSGVISKIPAHSALIYEIALLEIRDAESDAAEPAPSPANASAGK